MNSMTHDESAFTVLVERHRRELQVHCYRMLGSFEESEDLVQETFLRAWRKRETYEARSTIRAWLYRIATNACLDTLSKRSRHAPSPGEVPWLEPYPDRLLDEAAASDDDPEAVVVARETIELAFVIAIQHLPPRQRAVLILRDVLGWPANDTASLLDVSVAAANSALQRARATLKQQLPERRLEWPTPAQQTAGERALVQRYIDASERNDAQALLALLHEDARFMMPPEPGLYVGRETIRAFWTEGGLGSDAFGDIRCIVTSANRQPAVANYQRLRGDSEFRALALDVVRIEDGAVIDVVAFLPSVFPSFGLPATL
jgi:RNA polymerase sigma-70 factor, ECF subfamily